MSGNSDQTVCSPEQLASSGFSHFYCYPRKQNVGLVVVSLAGFISLAAVITMFGLILRNIIRNRKLPKSERSQLIRRPMDLFLLSLFTADLFQSLGVVMDVRWINNGIVEVGRLCTAQGVLQNIGQAGIAMTTFIITVHTFDSIWRGNGGVTLVRWASVLVSIVWIFLVLAVVISTSVHKDPPFYAPTQYWCWISSGYPKYRIALESFWLWIGFAVAILYVPLLFWDTGRIVPGDPQWWTFKLHNGDARNGECRSNFIICALAYCLPVLPTSLARWFLVVHGDVKPFASAEAQFIVKGIFSLSGVCDVVAFKYARSGLLLFPSDERPESRESEASLKSESEISLHSSDTGVPKGPLRRHWRLLRANVFSSPNFSIDVITVPWLIINGLDAVWITFYIRAATDPNPRTAVNRSHAGWQAYYLLMYVFGFFWGCVNIVVCLWYVQAARAPVRIRSGKGVARSNVLHYGWKCARILVFVPFAVILGLGPFFSPVIGVRRAQEQAWLHRCDSFPVEIVLTGLSFNSPNTATPVASFFFRQNGILDNQYEYSLTNAGVDPALWRFAPAPGQALTIGQTVTYDVANSSLVVTCAGNTSQCTQGSFDES
ncbi:hypothetical protein DFH09DRAFT_1029846 [Mycena vulgaris]|nr:hypothetical protein DFH09DRAFT_1029846 [Mycena vulgaris]